MPVDLDARRLVRALLRSGLDAEEVLDVVIEELVLLGGYLPHLRVETTRDGTVIRFANRRGVQTAAEGAAVVHDSEKTHDGPAVVVNGENTEEP